MGGGGGFLVLTPKPEWWNSDQWETPPELLKKLTAEFGAFDLDPCCRAETAKAPRFYTEVDNGLQREWIGKVFLNPPYSKPGPWLVKALRETQIGHAVLVVALLPVRTDTRWFHDLVWNRAEIRFIRGRVYWLGWERKSIGRPKDPSMLAIYRAG